MEENKTKEPSKINWNELLRYPIITLCITLGFLLLKVVVGFDLSGITEITKDGVKFRDAETTQTIQQLTIQVSAMTEKQRILDSLLSANKTSYYNESGTTTPIRTRSNNIPAAAGSEQSIPGSGTAGSNRKNRRNWTATEIATDNVAKLSYIDSKGSTFLKNKEGYIWLGEEGSWNNFPLDYKREITITDGKPNIPFRKYRTSQNVTLREFPVDADNLSQAEAIGVIPRGVSVFIKDIEELDGEYWAKVIVEE